MSVSALPRPDVVLVGAGIIGLSLALEFHSRGAQVVVLERDTALRQASFAAAGMLAAEDPHNPPALLQLSRYSLAAYGKFLKRVEKLSGNAVLYQTDTTVQYLNDGNSTHLIEHSIDPRQLASALLAAAKTARIHLQEHTSLQEVETTRGGFVARTASGERISAKNFVIAAGAWTSFIDKKTAAQVFPCKGQMLRVRVPSDFPLREVHRSDSIYIVPRMHGPQAGTALIGATVEDAGFDTSTHTPDLNLLRHHAAQMLPELGSAMAAPTVEAWAGLRPATADGLPILGRDDQSGAILSTGHFRNGILLAPGTAKIIADMVEGKQPDVDLRPFSPARFVAASELLQNA